MVSVFCKEHEFENVEAVLFDKDGTFIDSNLYWGKLGENRIKVVMEYYRLENNLYDKLCETIGYNTKTGKLIYNGPLAILSRDEVIEILTTELKKYVNTDFKTIEEIFTKVHEKFLKDVYKYTKLIDSSAECFKRLKDKGLKLAVVTSDSCVNTVETLKSLQIENFFDVVIGKESCKKSKKTGEPALSALNKLGIKPQNTIVVGDAPMDGQMAKNANLQGSILVTTGQTNPNDLINIGTVVCNSLSEIKV